MALLLWAISFLSACLAYGDHDSRFQIKLSSLLTSRISASTRWGADGNQAGITSGASNTVPTRTELLESAPPLVEKLASRGRVDSGDSTGSIVADKPRCNPIQECMRRFLQQDATRHLIAGAAAGVVSTTAMAPLDIIRINLIVAKQQTGIIRVARQIYGQGGVFAFWRGNWADVLRTIPASAIRFCSFAAYKERLPGCFSMVGLHAPALTSLVAGGLAGMTSMALLFPLENLRTQMAASSTCRGVSMLAFARNLLVTQGASGFYRGLPASLVSVMPFFALRFGVYDILKRWHLHVTDDADVPSQFSAAYGFTAGLAATALTFPMEMVRRRAMLGQSSSNILKVAPEIFKAEGIRGLYKGYGVNVIKVAPASAITFLVYEAVRKSLDNIAGQPVQQLEGTTPRSQSLPELKHPEYSRGNMPHPSISASEH